MAENAFPVIEGSPEADPSPLTRPVKFEFPFRSDEGLRASHSSLGAVSFGMVLTALALVWKVRLK
jgi:hypothetical protein